MLQLDYAGTLVQSICFLGIEHITEELIHNRDRAGFAIFHQRQLAVVIRGYSVKGHFNTRYSSLNASSARSKCSVSCAAEICTRRRALPSGTTG